jgi:hypothetical protein
MTDITATRGLPKLHPQMYSYPVDHYRMLAAQPDRLDLNPPYQRGSVWGVERKRNLIKSLLMGLPVGAVFLNSRHIMQPDRVVDGKQRIEAILDFLGDRLAVPAVWFSEDDLTEATAGQWGSGNLTTDMVSYSDLTLPVQRRFNDSTVATYQTKLRTEAEERELFLLINYGGVAQGDMDADAGDGR